MLFYPLEVLYMAYGTPRITLRLESDWRKQLEAIAKERGQTVSDIIRTAIQEFVWNHSNEAK